MAGVVGYPKSDAATLFNKFFLKLGQGCFVVPASRRADKPLRLSVMQKAAKISMPLVIFFIANLRFDLWLVIFVIHYLKHLRLNEYDIYQYLH
jgi:hypothetical protein